MSCHPLHLQIIDFSALQRVPGSLQQSTQWVLMGGGFCTAALWDCITVAPCPHGEKASYKNLTSLSFPPRSFPHPASPYLGLHLSLSESSCTGRAHWTGSNLTAAISVTAKKRSRNRGKEKRNWSLFVFVCSSSEGVTCHGHTSLSSQLSVKWGETLTE